MGRLYVQGHVNIYIYIYMYTYMHVLKTRQRAGVQPSFFLFVFDLLKKNKKKKDSIQKNL